MHPVRFIHPRPVRKLRLAIALAASAALCALAFGGLQSAGAAGGGGGAAGLAALSTLPVPTPPDMQRFIRDNSAAQKLGKALFWDMQAGADGRQACASCHYNAGADNRSRNQINPRGGSFTLKGPNAQLTAADFPLHKLSDPNNSASAVLSDTDNVVGSQGVIPAHFTGINEGDPFDGQTLDALDPDFHVGSANVRRSTGRNTPSVINAVFNFRNFWDGRAQNDFNGVNPFGDRDAGARVGAVNASGGVDKIQVDIPNSSLASQADGPPGNEVEMSTNGRSLSDIGKKLLSVRPLASQQVSVDDSLLGGLVADNGMGLKSSYADLIKQAFQPGWWNSNQAMAANGRNYSLMQFNFPMFWGLAIQAYESTLVSDQTPVDKFLAGDTSALSPDAQAGMSIFNGKGGCASCHSGAALTDATVQDVNAQGSVFSSGTRDTGFHNIGVRPTTTDGGQAGQDPFGKPLSISLLNGSSGTDVGGTFKTPGLRNVALTAPYFHNGGELTLRQVVDFYSRGGDFHNAEQDPQVRNLALSDQEKDQLVAFLEALTDPRVRDQSAPFDHPELFVPIGEQTRADGSVITDPSGRAVDCFKRVPVTGAGGGAALAKFPDFGGSSCDAVPALERRAAPSKVAPTVTSTTTTKVVPGRSASCASAKWLTRSGRSAKIGLLGMTRSRVLACLGRPTSAAKSGSRLRWRYGKGLVLGLTDNRVTSFSVRSAKFAGVHGIGAGTSLSRVRKALGLTGRVGRTRAYRAVIHLAAGGYADVRVVYSGRRVTHIDVAHVAATRLDKAGRKLAKRR